MKRITLFVISCFILSFSTYGQIEQKLHSHNDYERVVPFYQAYAQGIHSIEADVFISKNGDELLVGHERESLLQDNTLETLYLEPLTNLYKRNHGKAWANSNRKLQLLIDIKSDPKPTIKLLIQKLEKYPFITDFNNPHALKIILSGERPRADEFKNYPDYISFDGNHLNYTKEQLQKIDLLSFNLKDYTDWNGKGTLKKDQEIKVKNLIEQVHSLGKPIRFWNTPDGITAWNTFSNFGVDFINTDTPELCANFFKNFEDKTYVINSNDKGVDKVRKAERLDKTTVGFQGFNNKDLKLSQGIEIYQPTYKSDGKEGKIKNIILLIGDGTGLNQLQVASTVNSNHKLNKTNGLTIFNMKHIGFQNTSSKDAYTTDSAAGGSALATGVLHDNRHISMSSNGVEHESIVDFLQPQGYACGVITLGNIADATPAAFYGHTTERDFSDEITRYLLEGKLTVLNGAGMSTLAKRKDNLDLVNKLSNNYIISDKISDIDKNDNKIICIDERMDLAANEETLDLLAEATRRTINKLENTSKKGFFLMVEGAKIDYAGHANSLPGSILETLSFDLAVQEALKFADTNNETLVIVTGDHETGGLTLIDGNIETGEVVALYVTDDHTPMMLPVFSYGPHANKFTGVYKNTEIINRIKSLIK